MRASCFASAICNCAGWSLRHRRSVSVRASSRCCAWRPRCADGIMMSDMPPAPAAQAIATLDAALQSHGRQRPEFATNVFTAWHVYQDREQALREARRWLLLRGIFRPWLLAEFLDPADVELVMASEAAFARAFAAGSHLVEGVPDRVLDRMVDKLTVSGSPDDLDPVIDKLRQAARCRTRQRGAATVCGSGGVDPVDRGAGGASSLLNIRPFYPETPIWRHTPACAFLILLSCLPAFPAACAQGRRHRSPGQGKQCYRWRHS